jgi:hypothetical protein
MELSYGRCFHLATRTVVGRLCCAILTLAVLSIPGPAHAAPAVTVRPSGMWGGGFINVIATDPADPLNTMEIGGDVSGFHRSIDGGTSWITSNEGMEFAYDREVAAIAYDPTDSAIIYAGIGDGTNGGVFRSMDGGATWTPLTRDSDKVFNGQFTKAEGPLPGGPTTQRSSGNLISVDTQDGVVFFGTYRDGVWRYDVARDTWAQIALAPNTSCVHDIPVAYVNCYIRTLIADPLDPDTLFVGTYGDQAFRISAAARERPRVQQIPSSPLIVEELAFDMAHGVLYCACGTDGVYKAVGSLHTNWRDTNLGSIETGGPTSWTAVATGADGSAYVGAATPAADPNGTSWRSVKRLTWHGTAWRELTTDPTKISIAVGGTDQEWWLGDPSYGRPIYLLGGPYFDASMILVEGSGPSARVYVTGRAGIWRSDDGGDTWNPYVQGIGASVIRDLRVPPSPEESNLYIGAIDWTFLHSEDHGASVARRGTDVGPDVSAGFALAVDAQGTVPRDVYLGAGDPEEVAPSGQVYYDVDPQNSAWSSTGLTLSNCQVDASENPIGIAVNRKGSDVVRVAAVDGCGVWRRQGGQSWSQMERPTFMLDDQGPIQFTPVVWPSWSGTTNEYVFVLDRQAGKLYRSQDWGVTWATILSVPGAPLDPFTGFLAADPTTLGRLWLTTNQADGTYVIDNAQDQLPNCVAMVNCTKFATPANPGPVTVRTDGKVFVAGRIAPGLDAELWSATSPFTVWTPLATPEYRGAAGLPLSLVATSPADQHVYVGTGGNGVVVVSGVT